MTYSYGVGSRRPLFYQIFRQRGRLFGAWEKGSLHIGYKTLFLHICLENYFGRVFVSSSILNLARGRGHRQAYIASRVLAYSGFSIGFIGIYSGIFRLACYELQCPLPPLTAHADLLLNAALPLVIIAVGSLLSPAYYAYPPHGLAMIPISVLGVFYAALSLIDPFIDGVLGTGTSHVLLFIVSLLFSASNLDLFARRRIRGFLCLMNISFTLSSILFPIYSLSMLIGLATFAPPWLPLVAFVTPMVFSVMLRTDPYTRKWYREDLSLAIFLTSIMAIASGFISIVGASVGSDVLLDLALTLLAGSMIIAGALLIPRKSSAKLLREYELSIKISIPWGLSGLLLGLTSIPGSMDFLTHTLALGFVGNVFMAYSRFLLPYRPFTPGIMRALDLPTIVIINIGILFRALHSLLLWQLGGMGEAILGVLSLSSSILIGGALAIVAIKILSAG